ncbi:methyltransferase [Desulfoscipio sp. XC116]|uniref:methyltransferase n=1 Tax=Desulfoscipio sp. XC116 TaxID=3144975 RepID=UPI00325C1F91
MDLPKLNVSFKNLYDMLMGRMRSKLLLTAIEWKVFNYLIEAKPAIDVARLIGGEPDNTRFFLDGLAACGLLEKRNGMYKNSYEAEVFLVEGRSTYLGEFFMHNVHLSEAAHELPRLIKEGPPLQSQDDMGSADRWARAAVYNANYERAGVAQKLAVIISQLPEFENFQRMLDLGGGPGIIGMAIVDKHPGMRGVVFDQPEVVKVSQAFIKEYEMENRMEVMGGNYFTDSIGENYDLILAKATLNFAKDNIDFIMKKIYDALNPGGVCIVVTDGLTHEKTKPEIMVLGWLPAAMTGCDMAFEQGFIADAMIRVGFKSVRGTTVDFPMGPMDMEVARK